MEHKCKKTDIKSIEKCELNAEQIKKALECCASSNEISACESGCPLWEEDPCPCNDEPNAVIKCALTLINELTEENERLRAENERLKADCVKGADALIQEMQRNRTIEADTITKMHSMLCEGRVSNDNVVIVANQIAKEMLEGE